MSTENLPVRVNGKRARALLGVVSVRVWRKVVDNNPQMVHRIPGEIRPKYLTRELLALLERQRR